MREGSTEGTLPELRLGEQYAGAPGPGEGTLLYLRGGLVRGMLEHLALGEGTLLYLSGGLVRGMLERLALVSGIWGEEEVKSNCSPDTNSSSSTTPTWKILSNASYTVDAQNRWLAG